MNVTTSERLEQLIQNTSQPQDFVAYLISYNATTHQAVVGSDIKQTTGITIGVSATLQAKPALFQPGVQVHVRKIGNYPPIITDILNAAVPKATIKVVPIQLQSETLSYIPDTFNLAFSNWAPNEVVVLSLYTTNGTLVELPESARRIFNVTVDDTGSLGSAVFSGQLQSLHLAVPTPFTLRGIGQTSDMEVSIPVMLQ